MSLLRKTLFLGLLLLPSTSFAHFEDDLYLSCTFETGNEYDLFLSASNNVYGYPGPLIMYQNASVFQTFEGYIETPQKIRATTDPSVKKSKYVSSLSIDRTTGEINYTIDTYKSGGLASSKVTKGSCEKSEAPSQPTKF